MLFRTVYGPELAAIYEFIRQSDAPLPRRDLHLAFITNEAGQEVSTQSVDDALSFLESAHLIAETKGRFAVRVPLSTRSFRVGLLRQLRLLELGQLKPLHPLDPHYLAIVTRLFIEPNQLFVNDVHQEANQLDEISTHGGLSREKLQAWRRVMAYLGLGQRLAGGFQCAYAPQLVSEIIEDWPESGGTLQDFFEHHFDCVLPYQTATAELATAVAAPLDYLHAAGRVTMSPLQDSPSKPYFGERKLRQLVRQEVGYALA